jgi:hypothetical protein
MEGECVILFSRLAQGAMGAFGAFNDPTMAEERGK